MKSDFVLEVSVKNNEFKEKMVFREKEENKKENEEDKEPSKSLCYTYR